MELTPQGQKNGKHLLTPPSPFLSYTPVGYFTSLFLGFPLGKSGANLRVDERMRMAAPPSLRSSSAKLGRQGHTLLTYTSSRMSMS